jgi:cytochrome c oxidase subunit II
MTVGKFWSLLFLLVPVLGVASFVVAPWYNHWLPRDISQHGHVIDHLFYFILWLTGAVFVVTEVVLFWFLWRYDSKGTRNEVKYTHGSHSLEIVWTIVPASVLLFIAIYQMNAWADSKIDNPAAGPDAVFGTADDLPSLLEVTGRQFEWRLRYPLPEEIRKRALKKGEDEKASDDPIKDLYVTNDLHLPINEVIVIDLKSADVLHSFFLPNVRVKQDAVPGMKIPIWFRATELGRYDLVCAELCGWGHYKMKGRLTVESREDFNQWLEQKYREQEANEDPQLADSKAKGDSE